MAKGEAGGVGVVVLVRVGEAVSAGGDGRTAVGEAGAVGKGSQPAVEVGATTGRASAQRPTAAVRATIATMRTAQDATLRRT